MRAVKTATEPGRLPAPAESLTRTLRSPVFPGQGISDSYATWCFSNHANSTSLGVIYPNAE